MCYFFFSPFGEYCYAELSAGFKAGYLPDFDSQYQYFRILLTLSLL